jgi:hypothetical protein
MLETMLLGAILLYSSVLMRYFQATSLTCLLEPWLRELGFSTFYGSILIKLYRILTEFQTRKAHRVCLRDKDQIVYLLAIVLIVIGYMSAWTALMVDGFFLRQDAGDGVDLPPFVHRQPTFPSSSPPPSPSASPPSILRHAREKRASGGGDYAGQPMTPDGAVQSGRRDAAETAFAAADWPMPLGHHQLGGAHRSATGLAPAPNNKIKRELATSSASLLNDHLEILARGLNSFGELFLGLLETDQSYDPENDTFVYSIRCRKLTWDYVTESSKSHEHTRAGERRHPFMFVPVAFSLAFPGGRWH